MKNKKNELEFELLPKFIPNFLELVKISLRSNRVKTAYGASESTHWFHSGICFDSRALPIVCVFKVQRQKTKKGKLVVKTLLVDVRPPKGDEMEEGGYVESFEWSLEDNRKAWSFITNLIEPLTLGASQPPNLTKVCRGYLSFYGTRISGEYWYGPWRLLAPHFPDDPNNQPTIFTEQVVACDREVVGNDPLGISIAFSTEMQRLSVLLTVFWCTSVTVTENSSHRWTYDGIVDGELICHLRQLGFSEPKKQIPKASPLFCQFPPGPCRKIDRLNPDHYFSQGGGFRPPEDAQKLLEIFFDVAEANPVVSERFLSAAKAYQIAGHIGKVSATGALAYLVVAAESLNEVDLAVCPKCKMKTGALAALRQTFFSELPCLLENESQVRSILSRVYDIRSLHFHTGEFMAGELEPWRAMNVLQPENEKLSSLKSRFMAMTNSLLVAWLCRHATEKIWGRAVEPFPIWQDHQVFSVSVHLRGSSDE